MPTWLKASNSGTPEGMYLVGMCYLRGYGGLDADTDKAIDLLNKSASKEFGLAQNQLGICYDFEEGVEVVSEKAVEWYQKAVQQKELSAYFNLAESYENGTGVEEDLSEAIKLYKKAAEGGFVMAIQRLITVYAYGEGDIKLDQTELIKWYQTLGDVLGIGKARHD
jgi:hypothetical protein